tara:strand:- start:81 stop:500 length:420 start_codon:yes stop_codon:yes gene_type:complete
MNKEQLKVKLAYAEAQVEQKRDELGFAASAAQVAREELANIGKPVISESVAADLVEQLAEMFRDVLSNADPGDLNPEFGLNGNEIYLECIDVSDIGVSDHDINGVLEDFFAIEEDKDEDETRSVRGFDDENLISPDIYK